jgi:hypothetical protein
MARHVGIVLCSALALVTETATAQTNPPQPPPVVSASGHLPVAQQLPTQLSDATIQAFAGMLTFTAPDNFGIVTAGTHYCTAQIIAANVILTAAHCARSGFTDYNFVVDGDHSKTYTVKCVTRNSNWLDPATNPKVDPFINLRFDYAFLRTNESVPTPSGLTVDYSNTWYQGITNKLPGKSPISIGYPAAEPISGLYALTTQAFSEVYHPSINSISTADTSFTKGISGGAWLLSDGHGGFTVESLNSSYAITVNNLSSSPLSYVTVYGPILDGDAQYLAQFTAQSTASDGSPSLACVQ